MNITPYISIIIPVYGVEKYIKKCLESVLLQTFTDFECLVIDDGSTDNSINIAKEAVAKDPRFIFLNKKNGGVASARNYGIKHAKGKYIAFIDSDDYVEPDFLLLPLTTIEAEDSDICMFSINYVAEDGTHFKTQHNNLKKYYEENDFLISKNTLMNFSYLKLYKKEIFDSILFDETVITYEDVDLNFRIIYGRKVSNIKKPLYNYMQRKGSLSHDIKPTYLKDIVAITKKQDDFVLENNLINKNREYINFTYLKTFIFSASIKLVRYSKNYSTDVINLKKSIDSSRFTFKNILFVIKQERKVGLSLLLFKLSPSAFRSFSRFWFKAHLN